MKNLVYLIAVLSLFAFASCEEADLLNICFGEPREGIACTTSMEPVCGCNNVTYSNQCIARNAGILSWKKGRCL